MVEMPGLYFVIANADRARFVRPDPTNSPHTIRTIDAITLQNQPGGAFPDALARIIEDEFAVDLFTDLVLVAPSALLRALTAAIDAPTRASLIGSLTADLVAVPDDQLRLFLDPWLPTGEASE
jgi:Protein required for attachment to host cells